jgi:hypothetical protein
MAFRKKTAKDQYCSNVRINEIAHEAFRAQVVKKYYEERFDSLKRDFFNYVHDDPSAPEVTPGAGNGLKIEDHGSISFSAPERLQNDDAVRLLLERVKDGTISVDDFASCVSTVNVSNTKQVLCEDDVSSVTKPDVDDNGKAIVVITFRASAAYKRDLHAQLENPAAALVDDAPVQEPGLEEAVEITKKAAKRSKKAA